MSGINLRGNQRMKFLLPILLLITSACTIYSTSDGRLPSSYYEKHKVTMMGASNTAGMGASLSFPDRINDYLLAVPDIQKIAIRDQNIFIAFDYFFPTNFSALNDQEINHLIEAERIIQEWSNQYDQVFIMQLPQKSDEVSERTRKYLDNANKMNPYKNILDVLSDPQISSRVKSLNKLIKEKAQSNGRIHAVDFSGIYQNIHDYSYARRNRASRRKAPKAPAPKHLFKDPLHLNDLGQAVFFNSIILPELNNTFQAELPPMSVAKLSEEKVRKIIKGKLCDSETFMNQDECQYWVMLKDPSQYKLKNAKFFLPASYNQNRKAQTFSANRQRQIWGAIEEIDSDFKRKSALDVMAIAEIIDGNGENAEKGLMIKVLNNREKVYLDLSKVLFFTTFPIFLDAESGNYSNWGYDHWLSYKYLYTRWSYSGMYSEQSLIGRMKSPAPGTNYKIDVQFDKSEKSLHLKWRIYPTVKDQADEQSRLEYISEPHLSEIKANQDNYPYIEYELDFRLDDMD